MAGSDFDSSDYEVVDAVSIAKDIVEEKKIEPERIKAWLNPTEYTSPSSEYHRHLSSQSPGTGEWIRETNQFKQWYTSEDHGSIWIKAIPGAGKSVVAASMTDSLNRQHNGTVPVLYFFFRQIIEKNRTARSLLRDWLSQLLPFSETLQVSLWDYVNGEEDLDTISTDQLWKHLLSALKVTNTVYCIVDALDEMTIDVEFLGKLNELGNFRPANVKVLMTSRPKQYLQRALRDPQVIHVSLEEKLVKRDISVFVSQRSAEFDLDAPSQSFVEDTICERSQGLFLYARLMLDQVAQAIQEQESKNSSLVTEMVRKLPTGLEDMYNQVLSDHAKRFNIDDTLQLLILQLVTHSARPLRLIEIASAVESKFSHSITTINGKRDAKDIVRTACGPLLEIMEDEVVQILHHSFTEFLLDESRLKRHTKDSPQFHVITPESAHKSITIICLSQLQSHAFSSYPDAKHVDGGMHGIESDEIIKRFDYQPVYFQYPLIKYAAWKWTYHARQYTRPDDEFFSQLCQFCTQSTTSFRAWQALVSGRYEGYLDLKRREDISISSFHATPLHVAAGFGLTAWAGYLIQNGADLDALDSSKNSPLFWAAKQGWTDVVKLLLQNGAKPDIDGYDGLKPMHVAASRNHAEIVKMLLEAGVLPTSPRTKDIRRRCGNGPSRVGEHGLQHASTNGHLETVLEMVPYASRAEVADALCNAAMGGHSTLVSALLSIIDSEKRPSPNFVSPLRSAGYDKSVRGQPVLNLAVKSLDVKCVKILLEHGADTSVKSAAKDNTHSGAHIGWRPKPDCSYNAFHAFASRSIKPSQEAAAEEICKLLLAAGAGLEDRDGEGNTPLFLSAGAASSLNETHLGLKMLLELGADINAVNTKSGESLLHHACKIGAYTTVVDQLLKAGVDVTKRAFDGTTSLFSAIGNNRCSTELIELLVNHGVDINAQDNHGNSVLHKASSHHSAQDNLIRALLRLGSNPNIKNDISQTALHVLEPCFATRPSLRENKEEHGHIIGDFIDAGADLDAKDREGMTPLHMAVQASKNVEMVRALFQHPARRPDISARLYRNKKTALHLAVQFDISNSLEILNILVENGGDPTWTDGDGNTLLHEIAARFEGSHEDSQLIRRLVELGVSMHALNNRRRSVAHVVPINCSTQVRSMGKEHVNTREFAFTILSRLDPELDINIHDIDGYTPLHLAAAVSEFRSFGLIQAGANLSARAYNGRTPLHCAARGRQAGILQMILQSAKESTRRLDYDEARALLPSLHAASLLDQFFDNRTGPPQDLVRFVEKIDLATMDALVARSTDFTVKGRYNGAITAIGQLVRLGLFEYVTKILAQAKLFDDWSFVASLTKDNNRGWESIRPLLQLACDQPFYNMEMVKLLVDKGGVNVNAHQRCREHKKNDYSQYADEPVAGSTALHVLAEGNFWWQVEAIHYLVERGADVNALDEKGQTPLYVASGGRRSHSLSGTDPWHGFFKPQCCEVLLKLGANPNALNPLGLTPLNYTGSDAAIIKTLLKYGADVNAGSKGALMSAIEVGDISSLKIYLEAGADCNIPDTALPDNVCGRHIIDGDRYPLCIAALPPLRAFDASVDDSIPPKIVKLLLDHGAKIDHIVGNDTLIHYLFQCARSPTLRPFVETPGLDLNIRNQRGHTVFMAALCSARIDGFGNIFLPPDERKRLADCDPSYMILADSPLYGPSIDYLAVDNVGEHIIFYLVRLWKERRDHVLKFLSMPGVKTLISRKNHAGFSPIHRALRDLKIGLCELFIAEGADILEPDPNGNTALHYLFRNTHWSTNNDMRKRIEFIEKFPSLYGLINRRNDDGETPLLTYLSSCHVTSDGSEFHNEATAPHDAGLEFFINHGADFTATNNKKETALHVLARRPHETPDGSIRVKENHGTWLFRRLVESGCDPLLEDDGCRTALDVAAVVGNKEILGLYQRKKEVTA
ncbi:ankyrin repeat-containing domain protein [Xylogone sp. PMI_703]|nr:ankyrin repeat-containing domain protein [Xylogone sp. PMI_703]